MSETGNLGKCTWCDEPATDQLIVERGRQHRKIAPVCNAHAQEYEQRGLETVGSEVERKAQAALRRAAWKRNQQWR